MPGIGATKRLIRIQTSKQMKLLAIPSVANSSGVTANWRGKRALEGLDWEEAKIPCQSRGDQAAETTFLPAMRGDGRRWLWRCASAAHGTSQQ